MNTVILSGRLAKSPETRYAKTGGDDLAITRMTIAVDRTFKYDDSPDTDFFIVNAYGKTAENINKYLTKGSRVTISGRLRNESWTDKDGVKKYATSVVVYEVDFLDTKAEFDALKAADQKRTADEFTDTADDGLPFA